jgi:hypothetical protein
MKERQEHTWLFSVETNPLVPLVLAYQLPIPSPTIAMMSEDLTYSQPRRTNANLHPAQAVLDAKQKHHTPAQKAADDEAKLLQEKEEATNAQKNRQAAVAQIGELEDALQEEDKTYPKIVSKNTPATLMSKEPRVRQSIRGGWCTLTVPKLITDLAYCQ